MQRFLALRRRQGVLEKALARLKEEASQLEKDLVEEFAREGVQNVKLSGETLYLQHKVVARARDGDRTRVAQALITSGLGDYVKLEPSWNTQAVEAWLREALRNGEDIPAAVREALEVTELVFLRVRSS